MRASASPPSSEMPRASRNEALRPISFSLAENSRMPAYIAREFRGLTRRKVSGSGNCCSWWIPCSRAWDSATNVWGLIGSKEPVYGRKGCCDDTSWSGAAARSCSRADCGRMILSFRNLSISNGFDNKSIRPKKNIHLSPESFGVCWDGVTINCDDQRSWFCSLAIAFATSR
ncbi:hypothetical protein BDW68DRAFT_113012 [Aspergillus falconensis]